MNVVLRQNEHMVFVSLFQSVTNPTPTKQAKAPWHQIASMLVNPEKRRITPDKHSVELISFAEFAGSRAIKNIKYVTVVVLDLDNGTSLETILNLGKSIEFVAHSTHSHTPKVPKFRIIAPLLRPVTVAEYSHIWIAFNEMLGGEADQIAKDASRISYLPSCPKEYVSDAFAYHHKGRILDPDKMIQTAVCSPAISKALLKAEKGKPNMTQGYPDGQRTNQLMRRVGWCLGPDGMSEAETLAECLAWNEHNTPKLPENKICEAVHNIAEKEKENSKSSSKVDHLGLARIVINDFGKESLLATAAHVWAWRHTGVWCVIDELEIKQHIQLVLEKIEHEVKSTLVEAVLKVLKADVFAKEHEWNRNRNVINFRNGELHWNGSVWELREHYRESYQTTQVPHEYLPRAECPRFIEFLNQVFEGDNDKKEKAALILELLGYTLVAHARFETFVLLLGNGANGKSVLLEVIRVMVGSANVAAVSPIQFNNRFQRAHLHLKLANLVTEIAEGGEVADAELKAIVSGELTTAENKFQHPFDFQPFCTCWFGSNHLPHTRDFSDALFRRAKVISFNRVFTYGVDADPDLKDKLTVEISGIITLATGAFAEVLKRGKFTEPQSCIQAKQEWRIEADQVAQFVAERCECISGAITSSSDLYCTYKHWASEAGVTRLLGRKNFANRLVRLGCQTCKGTGGTRMIAGIKIKEITL